MAEIAKGCQYFKTLPSILKILEFVVLLIALGAVGYFYEQMDTQTIPKKRDILRFFLFAIIVAWILVIVFWVTFISGLHQKITPINWPLTVVIIFAVWAIFLLVASALLADTAKSYEDDNTCALLDAVDSDAQCEHLITGAVCGFIAMVLFIADSVVHFGIGTASRPATAEVN